jgi:photosystem II stability/assembly factor-like uncharacterized protein
MATILHTSNGGANWQTQNSGTQAWLYSVYFVDKQTGWAVGGNGMILHTSNGGANWQTQNSGTQAWLHSVHFVDKQTGWAAGADGTILHTSNGGVNWQTQNSGTQAWLESIYFVDKQTGWAVGNWGEILHTLDGGSSWKNQSSDKPWHLNSVYFIDNQTGWAVGSNGIILKYSCNSMISIPEIGAQAIAVYPNPTAGLLRIQGLYGKSALILTDLMSRIILAQQKINETDFILDISTLPAGWYILQISANGKALSYKVWKE